MIIVMLLVLGLMFGSFVNALVWRLRQQEELGQRAEGRERSKKKAKVAKESRTFSILYGRSMCTECHHELKPKDLVPVLSWLSLRGKCRYCHKPISWQYPAVELTTAGLFVASYVWWPQAFNTAGVVNFVLWLVVLVGFMALLVYDMRWLILPNRIVYPLIAMALAVSILNVTVFHGGLSHFRDLAFALLIACGLFYALFEASKGKWIGGGDVKLGFLLGLLLATPALAFLTLFLSSLIGTVFIIPGMLTKKLTKTSHVPFGPFLIVAAIIIKLFGASLISWYRSKFLLY